VVGLKPTIGVISRSGVVPISSNLDTAGPMTKNVLDTAILMHALVAVDSEDSYSFKSTPISYQNLASTHLKGKRFGLIQSFKDDRLMQQAVLKIKEAGAEVITFDPPEVAMDQFRKLLDVDMKADLPKYIEKYASKSLVFDSVQEIVAFNRKDSLLHAPYGQGIFLRIAKETLSQEEFSKTKNTLMKNAERYFVEPMKAHDLDAVLSIDNRTASYAAAAHYPALGVPMGFTTSGQPQNLTLITPSKTEQRLLELGAAIERLLQARKTPELFK
jgi:amidase